MNVLARAGVCWLVLACFSMTVATVPIKGGVTVLFKILEMEEIKKNNTLNFRKLIFNSLLYRKYFLLFD